MQELALSNSPAIRTDVHGNVYKYGWMVTEPYFWCNNVNVMCQMNWVTKYQHKLTEKRCWKDQSKADSRSCLTEAEKADKIANEWYKRIKNHTEDSVSDLQWKNEELEYKAHINMLRVHYLNAKKKSKMFPYWTPEAIKTWIDNTNSRINRIIEEYEQTMKRIKT